MIRILMVGILLCKCLVAFSSNEIDLSATAYHIPVLRGLTYNPIIRIQVTKSGQKNSVGIQELICNTEQSQLASIQKITVFQNTKEVFEYATAIGSIQPTTTTIHIPIKFQVKDSSQYLWISVELNPRVIPQQKLVLQCISFINHLNQEQGVQQAGNNYSWYTGYAVRKAGDDSVHTYRIPGIIKTTKGTLIAVYDNRYKTNTDLPGNIDVGMSRSKDNGLTWEPMKVIMDMGPPHENNGIGDPAILYDAQTKKIWVAALWSKGNRSIAGSKPGLSEDTTGQLVLVNSDDDGKTWSKPISITPQIKNPDWHIFFQGPGSGIQMKNGNLVFAAQYWDEKRIPYSTIIYSDDHGKRWKGKLLGPKSNTTESQVVETDPGVLMLNMRDNRGKFRSIATTNNMGQSWQEHPTSYNTLIDPICMGSLIKANMQLNSKMQELLFFSNPNSTKDRSHISIKASLDLGASWLPEHQFLVDERKCFGYSSLTRIDANTIGILYEGSRDLYFVAIPITEIIH